MASGQLDERDPLLGRLIGGKFRIERVLGTGGMGRVYLAEQTNLAKQVAIKVLHEKLAGDPALALRFKREATSASALSHPNILHIIDFGDEDGVLYIAMELLAGRDLREVLRREWPLGPQRVAHIVAQILGALDEAHAKGIVHRDLKPENVMLIDVRGEEDFVKVCDFGIAKALGQREEGAAAITVDGNVCGTPEYMAPEQARGEAIDGRADLYSAAIILYQLVTGELPFRAESSLGVVLKQLNEAPVPPSQKRPGLTIAPELEAVILRGLAKDRAKRWTSAVEMKRALLAAVGDERAITPPLVARPADVDLENAATGVATPPISDDQLALAPTGVSTPPPSAASPTPIVTQPAPSHARGYVIGAAVALLVSGGAWYGLHKPDAPTVTPHAAVAAPPPRPSPSVATPAAAAPAIAAPPAVAPAPVEKPLAAVPAHLAAHTPHHAPAHHVEAAASSNTGSMGGPSIAPRAPMTGPSAGPPATAQAAPPANDFPSLFAAGEAAFKSGKLDDALAKYQAAARLDRKSAVVERQIGKCYTRLGQSDKAAEHFRRYLELAPDASDASFYRGIVDGK